MDKDLLFFKDLENEKLNLFVDTMIKQAKVKFIPFNFEDLTSTPEYKKYGKDYRSYWDVIANEYLAFGSNTIKQHISGKSTYRKILIDVCKNMKVNFNEKQTTLKIEDSLLQRVLEDVWEKMSDEEKETFLGEVNELYGTKNYNAIGTNALIWIFKSGGFSSYKLLLIIVNAIYKSILGKGLSLAANRTITKGVSVLVGPIGTILSGVWLAYDFAGPAYRVTVPCTVLIAAFRQIEKYEEKYPELESGKEA